MGVVNEGDRKTGDGFEGSPRRGERVDRISEAETGSSLSGK